MPREKIRYCLIVPETSHFTNLITDSPTRPGLYQWYKAFKFTGDEGEIKRLMDIAPNDMDSYSIIHVNLSGDAQDIPETVKKLLRGSSTKLILNVDYPIESFQQAFQFPGKFVKAIWIADFVFAVEPGQQSMLQYLFSHIDELASEEVQRRKVTIPLIPHPCATSETKKFTVPVGERMDMLAVHFHRYSKHYIIPAMLVRNIKHPSGLTIPTMLLGCTEETMPVGMFDFQHSYGDWEKFIYMLSHCTVGLTYSTVSSHSRFSEECACIGLPCVGTNNQYMENVLFPRLSHGVTDFEGIRQSLERLIKDEAFYNEVTAYASGKVEDYNWENSKARLLRCMAEWGLM